MPAQRYVPLAVQLVADCTGGVAVWEESPWRSGPVDLAALGVSSGLVEGFRAWGARFTCLVAVPWAWASAAAEEWQAEGAGLAARLRAELTGVEVRYESRRYESRRYDQGASGVGPGPWNDLGTS